MNGMNQIWSSCLQCCTLLYSKLRLVHGCTEHTVQYSEHVSNFSFAVTHIVDTAAAFISKQCSTLLEYLLGSVLTYLL
jgi:hypothetical protein